MKLSELKKAISDFLFGLFLLEFYSQVQSRRKELILVLEFLIFGDMVGAPLFSNYYTLRLLPYFIGRIYDFKRDVLREKDIFEKIEEYHAH